MNYQIVSQFPDPPMVWVFTDDRTPAVKELLGKEAEAFIAGLETETATDNEEEK